MSWSSSHTNTPSSVKCIYERNQVWPYQKQKKQTDVRCTYRTILHLLIFPVKSCDIFQWDGFKDKMLEMYTAQANKRSKPNMFARTHANTSVWIWMNYSSLCAWVSMWCMHYKCSGIVGNSIYRDETLSIHFHGTRICCDRDWIRDLVTIIMIFCLWL